MASEHTVKVFDEELQFLFGTVREMGALALGILDDAVVALMAGDAVLAAAAAERDVDIDTRHHVVTKRMQEMLVLRQPMAVDLREIVACARISADLERVGDHAKNIAKRAATMAAPPPAATQSGLRKLADSVRDEFYHTLGALADRDMDAAWTIWRKDKLSDAMFEDLMDQILSVMQADKAAIPMCMHLLFIAKGLERIGDHATNIAEDIVFWVSGELVTVERPKG